MTVAAVKMPLCTIFQPIVFCKISKNKKLIKGKAPLTILGMVVAAVALKFVPNCSAAMVLKIAQ